MIYFTSDLHLGQKGIDYVHPRGYDCVEDMNDDLIRKFNARVKDDDIVYIVGDVCNGISIPNANELISRLNGQKILITGNHDKAYDRSLFVEILDYKHFVYRGYTFVLMHYPMLEWYKKNKGSIHIHGHLHAARSYNLNNRKKGIRRYDCGVEANSFMPVSIMQIIHFYQKYENNSQVIK